MMSGGSMKFMHSSLKRNRSMLRTADKKRNIRETSTTDSNIDSSIPKFEKSVPRSRIIQESRKESRKLKIIFLIIILIAIIIFGAIYFFEPK